jgi:hypothetical protein
VEDEFSFSFSVPAVYVGSLDPIIGHVEESSQPLKM